MTVTKKALIIEDSQTEANVMAKIMMGLGYMVSTAGTGEEGLEEVKKSKPDLILQM